jgi:quercetin dioxygenase-like cupin family protein
MADDKERVEALVKEPWDRLALYHLSTRQAILLLSHHDVFVQEGWFPARHEFPEHAHDRAQMLLVTRGTLTHTTKEMSYTQGENDLLVVPATLAHTAKVGNEELEFYLVLKK